MILLRGQVPAVCWALAGCFSCFALAPLAVDAVEFPCKAHLRRLNSWPLEPIIGSLWAWSRSLSTSLVGAERFLLPFMCKVRQRR